MRRNRRKRYGKKERGPEDMVLQITSMADIFTIILVFLLKSVASGSTNISPSNDMLLPESVAYEAIPEATKLEISQNGILLDDKQVAELTNYRFQADQLESDGMARPLNIVFHDKRNPASVSPASADDLAAKGLLVMADKRTPYTTIKTVLDTLSSNGYSDFKLVVVEDQ